MPLYTKEGLLAVGDQSVKLCDDVELWFGDGAHSSDPSVGDVQIRWDGADLDMLAAADDTVFKIGNGTNSFDVWIYGNTASDYILWDASAGKLSLEGAAYLYGANVRQPITLAQGTGAVTAAQSGGVFVCTVDAVITLPSTAAGLTYTFINGALSSGTGLSISPAAADNIISTGLTAVDNKDLINSGATDVVGDCVTLVGDGVDGWIVTNMRGTWAKEA